MRNIYRTFIIKIHWQKSSSTFSKFISFTSVNPHRFISTSTSMMKYPTVHRDEEFVEELHGVKVADPYRWLEDPDSAETQAFVAAQNAVSVPYIEKCRAREAFKNRMTQLWNYPKYTCPFKRGNRYFFYMNTGLQNQSVMYLQDSLEGEPRVFHDPNRLSEDGTVAVSTAAFSEDGETFAYGLSASGSDWITVHFKEVASGRDYPEVLSQVKFSSLSWTHDHKGIFYGRFVEGQAEGGKGGTGSDENQKLFYHRLGTQQSEDVLVVEFTNEPKWRPKAEVTDCGGYLIVTPDKDCHYNLIYFAPLPAQIVGKIDLKCIVGNFEADYEYVTNDGCVCIFRTNKDASNYRLVQIDLNDAEPNKWTTLVPQHEKNVLSWAACVNQNRLVICYLSDVKNVLQLHSLATGEFQMTLPLDIGTVAGYSGKRNHTEMFYQFISFLYPGSIFHLNFSQEPLKPKLFREAHIEGFDPSKFVVKQVFYSSKDGTQVPMFIMHRRDLLRDGSAATQLYGYGGFNISLDPSFSVSRIVFMEMTGGIVAIPNLRGGGEYGEVWHHGGRLFNKQNTFDDFIAAAEYLIAEGYTRSGRLVLEGGSNGGYTVSACINQRPDLFGAAVSQVGVFDLLRFHKFTIGHAWCGDYGNPDLKEHFQFIVKLSPLHNVRVPADGGQYPAMLLLTADHDDRVVPLHSFKMIATLQHTLGNYANQTNPLLIRIETKAGHGAGKPTSKKIEEQTDVFCFIVESLGLENFIDCGNKL